MSPGAPTAHAFDSGAANDGLLDSDRSTPCGTGLRCWRRLDVFGVFLAPTLTTAKGALSYDVRQGGPEGSSVSAVDAPLAGCRRLGVTSLRPTHRMG